MEIVKSKKTNILIFIVSVIFLLISYTCFSQDMNIDRFNSYDLKFKKECVSRYPSYGLFFAFGKSELGISIKSDSIINNVSSVVLFVIFPKGVNAIGEDLTILFENNEKCTLRQISCDVSNYSEYEVNQLTLNKLQQNKHKSFIFETLGKFTDYTDNDFFINFFKILPK